MKLKDASLLRTQSYINGEWVGAADGRNFAVHNPADGTLIVEVADLGAADVTRAIDAAVPAQKAWAATPAKTRAMILRRWYDLIIENTNDLALIQTTETGNPLAKAKGEIAYGASFLDWFGEEAEAIEAANDTEFGLAAYLFTENAARLFRVSEALEYGIVAANTGIFSSEVGPFGGVKNSGLGREGSKYGIDEFLEIKFVCIGM